MLLPNERAQAIEILTNATQNNSDLHYNGSNAVKNILMYGHKGFASYTDFELLRAIQTLAKKSNNFEIQNFIATIAADKFILE